MVNRVVFSRISIILVHYSFCRVKLHKVQFKIQSVNKTTKYISLMKSNVTRNARTRFEGLKISARLRVSQSLSFQLYLSSRAPPPSIFPPPSPHRLPSTLQPSLSLSHSLPLHTFLRDFTASLFIARASRRGAAPMA